MLITAIGNAKVQSFFYYTTNYAYFFLPYPFNKNLTNYL